MARIIQGTVLARQIETELAQEVAQGLRPCLAVVLVGDDPASHIYVARKAKAAARVGIISREHRLPADISQDDLLALIGALNADAGVHGILVQLPLPPHIAANRVLDAIVPEKDVDGFHPVNVGRLSTGGGGLVPCTPLGCMLLLDQVVADFRGLTAVVIGKSNIVGKPAALLLLERECTVTVTHIHTRGLPDICRGADIIVAAAGSPHLVRGDWVKPGAILIDVGINRVMDKDGKSRILGDIAAHECDHAAALTPVPGGVGPMTIACLLRNTVEAARRSA
jgi:methylenetetrahydrofolate dehydrogenase (NADP+)/methenyltetrahydrofolate cyclohydrolase